MSVEEKKVNIEYDVVENDMCARNYYDITPNPRCGSFYDCVISFQLRNRSTETNFFNTKQYYYYEITIHRKTLDEEIKKVFTILLQCLYAYTKEPTFFDKLFDNRNCYQTKKFHSEFKPKLVLYDIDKTIRQIPYEYDTQLEYDLNTITFKRYLEECRKEQQRREAIRNQVSIESQRAYEQYKEYEKMRKEKEEKENQIINKIVFE